MNEMERRTEIAHRLGAAGAAHGEYETTVLNGEYDKQWAHWYASYLVEHGWNDLFPRKWSVPELAESLRRADIEQRAIAAHQPWNEYYAARFTAPT